MNSKMKFIPARVCAASMAVLLWACVGKVTISDVRKMEQSKDVPGLVEILIKDPGRVKRTERLEFIRARDEAAKALIRMGQVSVPRLVLALKNVEPKERTRVAWVLSRIRPQGAEALATWAETNPDLLTTGVASALAETRSPRAIPPLVKAFRRSMSCGEVSLAGEYAELIGKLGLPKAADTLASLWKSVESSKLKIAIMNGLGSCYSQAGFRLASTVLADPDLEVREAAATALGRMGRKGVEAVVRLFYSRRPDDRALGVKGVLAAGRKAALTLVNWMGPVQDIDLDVLVRLADAVALAVMNRGSSHQLQSRLGVVVLALARGLPDTAKALLSAFRSRNPNLRRSAALVLGLLQSVHAVPTLAHVVVEDPDPRVRMEAVKALALICDEVSVVVEVCKAVREQGRGENVFTGNELEQRAAQRRGGKGTSALSCDRKNIIGQCKGVALPAMAAAARDRSPAVKLATAKALVQLTLGGDMRDDPLLADTLRLLARDEDDDIRFEAQQGARTLDGL